jgi:MoxR-like ATPase
MLLHGPPGVGKTFAVREVARRLGEADGFRVQVVVVNGAEGMEGGGAEGAKKVRTLWADARDRCKPQVSA